MGVESERFARLRLLFKNEGLQKLQDATVMVLGLGGVGSACAEALARGGVGNLIVLDRDVVEESNINRQALAFTSTLGKVKAEVMEGMIKEIQPDCTVTAERVFLTPDNLAETLDKFPRPDYVIDCIDTITQKLAVYQWAAERGLNLVASMGAANRLDPTMLQFANIRRTYNCSMSKVVRAECRKRQIYGLEVLFSTELPFKVEKVPGAKAKGETLGSMSYMPPIMGQMLAGKVIRQLAGMEEIPAPPYLGSQAGEEDAAGQHLPQPR
ncbi:tRNA threonylcarbamoyladenosine dehydratase [Rothia sp. SD9660Na]|uniref:tRNA threonylcarbamoyladenosine dehydratase n=1 Tax=Rothia sp. SD9660Na TaxID=3047030 RepID=UPI0024BB5947|nr:tRNA threonylcarbamoyladenosine dehydratase [Rothia sp. SD9660Na]WHS51347.1 tRNA threonylcarbamoyladenosine dehydratase [Rothia sp. SD9660Na]